MAMKLKIVIGSTRPGRAGPGIAAFVEAVARGNEAFEVEIVDLAEVNLPLLDEAAHPRTKRYEHAHTQRWSRTVDEADAFVFVTPEYDYFPPASLVNAVQVLALEWGYKAAGIVSYGGISGGLRASQELRQLLSNVNMMALPGVVPVPFFTTFIGEDGRFDPSEKTTDAVAAMIAELARWSGALVSLRG